MQNVAQQLVPKMNTLQTEHGERVAAMQRQLQAEGGEHSGRERVELGIAAAEAAHEAELGRLEETAAAALAELEREYEAAMGKHATAREAQRQERERVRVRLEGIRTRAGYLERPATDDTDSATLLADISAEISHSRAHQPPRPTALGLNSPPPRNNNPPPRNKEGVLPSQPEWVMERLHFVLDQAAGDTMRSALLQWRDAAVFFAGMAAAGMAGGARHALNVSRAEKASHTHEPAPPLVLRRPFITHERNTTPDSSACAQPLSSLIPTFMLPTLTSLRPSSSSILVLPPSSCLR